MNPTLTALFFSAAVLCFLFAAFLDVRREPAFWIGLGLASLAFPAFWEAWVVAT